MIPFVRVVAILARNIVAKSGLHGQASKGE